MKKKNPAFIILHTRICLVNVKHYEKVSLLLYPVAVVCHQVLFQSNKVKLFSQLYVIFPTFYCRKYTLQFKAIR